MGSEVFYSIRSRPRDPLPGNQSDLGRVDKPWRVPFDYVPEGILCRGSWYPILKMEWIDANGLIPFIEAHLWQPPILADLAGKFARMIDDLALFRIAHGDLQHGNLLVTPAGELKLIDYDGMYVPRLDQLGASETGTQITIPDSLDEHWGPNWITSRLGLSMARSLR